MDIKAYIYVRHQTESFKKRSDKILCFSCAVKEALKVGNKNDSFVLTLEEGDTGCGNDMRSTLECAKCGEMFDDFNIG